MAKKKKDEDKFDEAQYRFIGDVLKSLGYVGEKLILTTVFIYLWWRAYGGGRAPTKEDVLLGIVYAFTVPEGLKGGTLANAYSLAVLSALGAGFIPDLSEFFEGFVSGAGQAMDWATSGYMPVVWHGTWTLPGGGYDPPAGTPSPEEFKADCESQGGTLIRENNSIYCVIGNVKTRFYPEYVDCRVAGGTMDLTTGTCSIP